MMYESGWMMCGVRCMVYSYLVVWCGVVRFNVSWMMCHVWRITYDLRYMNMCTPVDRCTIPIDMEMYYQDIAQ